MYTKHCRRYLGTVDWLWKCKKFIKQYMTLLWWSKVRKWAQFSVTEWWCIQPAIFGVLVKVVSVTRVGYTGQDRGLGRGGEGRGGEGGKRGEGRGGEGRGGEGRGGVGKGGGEGRGGEGWSWVTVQPVLVVAGLTINPRCSTWSQLMPLNHLWFLTSSAPCWNGGGAEGYLYASAMSSPFTDSPSPLPIHRHALTPPHSPSCPHPSHSQSCPHPSPFTVMPSPLPLTVMPSPLPIHSHALTPPHSPSCPHPSPLTVMPSPLPHPSPLTVMPSPLPIHRHALTPPHSQSCPHPSPFTTMPSPLPIQSCPHPHCSDSFCSVDC